MVQNMLHVERQREVMDVGNWIAIRDDYSV